jgi:hypothetical protein
MMGLKTMLSLMFVMVQWPVDAQILQVRVAQGHPAAQILLPFSQVGVRV